MTKQYGFLVDMSRCYGCKTCAMACKSEKNLPEGVLWRKVGTFSQEKPAATAWLSVSCHHCSDPACLKICPVKAYRKREDGVVIQDHEKCIGCKQCVNACPYHTPVYDPAEGKVSKCDLCFERLDEGLLPRCVEACPAGALQFDEIAKLKAQGSEAKVLVEKYGFVSPEKTKPNLMVVLPK